MFPYWTLFIIAASGAALEGGARKYRQPLAAFLIALCAYIAVFVGTRDSIGADWSTYVGILLLAGNHSVLDAISIYEPGYMLVNLLSVRLGGGILGANLVLAAIFAIGLCRFARSLPRPLLAVAAAVPYLVIVVAMGYNRQAAAIGVLLFALPDIAKGKLWRFLLLVALAASFHKSAILLGPIAALSVHRGRAIRLVMAAFIFAILYFIFLHGNVDRYEAAYLERGMSSAGAILRLAMSAIAGVGWLLIEKRIPQNEYHRRFWRLIAFSSIALFALAPISPSTTALDRIGLYFMPIQFVFAGYLVERIKRQELRGAMALLVIAFYGVFLATWFATTSYVEAWVPYRSFIM